MNRATILTIASVAVVAILVGTSLMIQEANASGFPSWLKVASSSEITNPANNAAAFSATTNGIIPHRADSFISENLITGFAWANLATGNAVVAVIHPSLKDDTQNPQGWHVHTVTLTRQTNSLDTTGAAFCVVSVNSSPETGVAITGNTISVGLLQSEMPLGESTSTLTTATGFVVNSDSSCGGLNLGVYLDP
ncbi:MAG: hypothetical protein ACREBI_05195 [Nitrosotalea sp.]